MEKEIKKAKTHENISVEINRKKLKSVNSLEGSYLMLEQIRDLLETQNNLLREQLGKESVSNTRPKVKSEIRKKRKHWLFG